MQPSRSSEYWAVAPWLVIASIPVCFVTLSIAAVTLATHARASGDRPRKNKVAAFTFLSLLVLVGAIAGILWLRHEHRQHDLEIEKELALEFVKTSDAVAKKVGGNFDALPSSLTTAHDGLPVRYEFAVRAKRSNHGAWNASYVFAIVGVSRSSGGTVFSLDCITALSMGQRQPFKDPCRQ